MTEFICDYLYLLLVFIRYSFLYVLMFNTQIKGIKKYIICGGIILLAFCSLTVLVGEYNGKNIMLTIEGLLYPLLFCREQKKEAILNYIPIYALDYWISYIYNYIHGFSEGVSAEKVATEMPMVKAIVLLVLCISMLLIIRHFRKSKEIVLFSKTQLLFCFLLMIESIFVVGGVSVLLNSISNKSLLNSIIGFGISVTVFLQFISVVWWNVIRRDQREQERRLELFENLIGAQKRQIYLHRENEAKIRRLKHDYRNNLIVIKGLISEKDYNGCHGYCSKLLDDFNSINKTYYTGNLSIDVILNYMFDMASNKGIVVKHDIQVSLQGFKQEYELCIILSNLLQNAIEASVEKGEIKLIMYSFENEYYIIIENLLRYTPIKQKDSFMTIKKNKNEHGIGLGNVKLAVEKLRGRIKIIYDEKKFKVVVVW